jgi:ubiquitin C-terminal hydrolase
MSTAVTATSPAADATTPAGRSGGAAVLTEADLAHYRAGKQELADAIKREGSALLLKRGPAVGLINQGATCYMNSLLQSLFWTTEFRQLLYQVIETLLSLTSFDHAHDPHGVVFRHFAPRLP